MKGHWRKKEKYWRHKYKCFCHTLLEEAAGYKCSAASSDHSILFGHIYCGKFMVQLAFSF